MVNIFRIYNWGAEQIWISSQSEHCQIVSSFSGTKSVGVDVLLHSASTLIKKKKKCGENFFICWIPLPRRLLKMQYMNFCNAPKNSARETSVGFPLLTISLPLNAGPQKSVRFVGASQGRGHEHEGKKQAKWRRPCHRDNEKQQLLLGFVSPWQNVQKHMPHDASDHIYGARGSVWTQFTCVSRQSRRFGAGLWVSFLQVLQLPFTAKKPKH